MLRELNQSFNNLRRIMDSMNPYQKGISIAEKANRQERMMYIAGALGVMLFGGALALFFMPHGNLQDFLFYAIPAAGSIAFGIHQGISALRIRMSEPKFIELADMATLENRNIEQIN